MKKNSKAVLLAFVLLLLTLFLSIGHITQAVPQDFVNEELITGLNQPVYTQFLPDGTMLILSLPGSIFVVQPGATQPNPTPLLQLTNINLTGGERGLVSMALDPDFANNKHFYIFYTADIPLRDRVTRWTMNATNDGVVAGSEVIIWQDDQDSGLAHHAGQVAFGPDGKLYISTGDHNNPPQVQTLDNYRGKVLRVNKDGTIPTDNPFVDGTGPNKDEIWAYGLRNPYRFTFDSVTGNMYIGEVGGNDPNTSIEEVNLGVAGANYGWPNCEGACSVPGTTDPIFSYAHNGRDASIAGGVVYRGSAFPAQYQGRYFFGDYTQNWIRYLTLDSTGTIVQSENFFEPLDGSLDGPYGDPVHVTEGPDGALYYADFDFDIFGNPSPGTIRRIRYTAGNQPPNVVTSVSPVSGPAPLAVAFSSCNQVSGTCTSDPEGATLTYNWDFGDGQTASNPLTPHIYQQNGTYTARLSVSDGTNTSLSAPITIVVGNPPTASITSPVDGATFVANDVINISGQATDLEDGTLLPAAFTWNIIFHHDGHIHPEVGPVTNTDNFTFTIPNTGHDFRGNTRYEIVLEVVDTDGLKDSASVFIFPKKVNLTFDTSPTGLTLKTDGISGIAPILYDTLIGFQHTLEAPNQTVGGNTYTFSSWSDGGAQLQTITAPTLAQTYTATYTATANDLELSYSFETGSGTAAIDDSGNGRHGTINGATWTTAGKIGGALSFDGIDDYVTSADIDFPTGGFTLSAWVKTTAPVDHRVLSKFSSGTNQIWLMLGSSGQVNAGLHDGVTWREPTDSVNIADGTWHHLALVVDATNIILYVDGINKASDIHDNTFPVNNNNWDIGRRNDGAEPWSGLVDEVQIYNRALSATEIVNLASQ